MVSGKKYGLIIKKKEPLFKKSNPSLLRPKLKAFCDDDDSDEETRCDNQQRRMKPETNKKIMKKQTKIEIQKALEEDSTVYEYDSIYDDMKANNEKVGSIGKKDKSRKPKYIAQLMKASERRNQEKQRIEERKIEREREKEGNEFSNKEAFVTSAYKKRMEERAREEEEERRQAAMEDALDVRKQKDLSGFYRHLLNRQMGEEPTDKAKQNIHMAISKESLPAENHSSTPSHLHNVCMEIHQAVQRTVGGPAIINETF